MKHFQKSFYKDSSSLLPGTGITSTIPNHRPIAMMTLDVKILSKILANQIQAHIKKITHHSQDGFILEMQG